jgi:ABC-type antimicrobial peptide transport system permease subunit
MDEVVNHAMGPEAFNAILFNTFAWVALLLAAIGVYGSIAYSVQQRTREVAIRIVLGARRTIVLKVIILQGMRQVGAGALIGSLAALVLCPFMSNLLYGVRPWDLSVFVTVPLVLITVATVAVGLPALKIMAINPASALRSE